jgi:hypothetical protein
MKKLKVHPIYFWLLAIIVALYLLVGTVAFWLFYPYNPLVLTSGELNKPIPVNNSLLEPGQALEYNLSYCKNTDGLSVVHKRMVDGQTIELDDITGTLSRGCGTIVNSTTIIPETVNPGKYYLSIDVEYRVNPIRYVNIRYRTAYFTVMAKPIPATAMINSTPVNILLKPAATST